MKERIYIYDRARNLVNDPERSTEYAEGLNWATQWPGGYGTAGCRVNRDIAVDWLIREGYYFQVKRGQAECYYGRLDDLKKALDNSGQRIELNAYGLWAALNERKVRKWWLDNHPMGRMHWPPSQYTSQSQMYIDSDRGDDRLVVRGGYGDVSKTNGDQFALRYILPSGTYVYRVESSYVMRTGEGMKISWINIDAGLVDEVSVTWDDSVQHTGSLNSNFTAGDTTKVWLAVTLTKSDIYDENDRSECYDMTIKSKYHSSHPDYGAPGFTTGEIMIDALLEAELTDVISSDWSLVSDPAFVPAAFASSGGNFEEVAKIVTRLAAFGDGRLNSFGPCVWGVEGSPDKKARFAVEKRRTDKPNYVTSLAELSRFESQYDFSQLHNYIIVKYTDEIGLEQYYTPSDDSSLTDAPSVGRYGRRDVELNIGKGAAADALRYGQRWLEYHKDPLPKGSFEQSGFIRNGQGIWQPAALVRAGQTVRVSDHEGGTTYFLRGTHFDSDTQTLQMEPDLPPDQIAIRQAQAESGW